MGNVEHFEWHGKRENSLKSYNLRSALIVLIMLSSTALSLEQHFRLGWLSAKHFTGDEPFLRIFPGEFALGTQILMLVSDESSHKFFIHSVCPCVCRQRGRV